MFRSGTRMIFIHVLYWLLLVLVFSWIWGTYDGEYLRNFFVQIWSLPSRLIFTYATLFFLFPFFYQKKKFTSFFLAGMLLLALVVICVQRPIIVFVVEGVYLPYKSPSFFNLIALVNTAIDVFIATIPLLFYHIILQNKEAENTLDEEVDEKKPMHHLVLKEGHTYHKVEYAEIFYIESQRNYLITKTQDLEIRSYGNMASVESILPSDMFLRIHRSYIVNVNKIDMFTSKSLQIQSDQLPIGRNYKQKVKVALAERFHFYDHKE